MGQVRSWLWVTLYRRIVVFCTSGRSSVVGPLCESTSK